MAVPALKLDLAPPSNLWRNNHITLGWAALALGGLILAGSLALTWKAYHSAAITGKLAGNLDYKTRATAADQSRIMAELRSVDVAKELPRWRLAERILTERSLPWSRITAELERSLVEEVRVRSLQRTRGADMKVQVKVKGEALSRAAEAAFVESLQKNAFFDQVILEREAERQGGGVDFEYTLAARLVPPPYAPLPRFSPKPAISMKVDGQLPPVASRLAPGRPASAGKALSGGPTRPGLPAARGGKP